MHGLQIRAIGAAGISPATILMLNLNINYVSNITAIINDGELLNKFQTTIGLQALGNIKYVSGDDKKLIDFYDEVVTKYNNLATKSLIDFRIKGAFGFGLKGLEAKSKETYFRGRAHTVKSILKSMNCL